MDDQPLSIKFVQEEDTLNADITAKDPPPLLGSIVGDAVHNLRTALDLMATELVTMSGGSAKSVYFPFGNDLADFEKQIKGKNFHRAGADAVDLLRTLAPYVGGNAALRGLHDLDVQDKHKTLIPVPHYASTHVPMTLGEGGQYTVGKSTTKAFFQFPADSAFAGKDLVPTLKELVQLVEGILQAFAALVAARTP